ncbi:PD-(D/E)XK nuclease-like domain-containing protein [Tenggerimyces flavus]|uniref:PD-(D/E)XK nuclease-like domain-containing protein n=1 Tax=Tenggerimyces flavus TaxID=1708749 RepID=A0ABV7YAV5_9ACTN|nr:PD-(D/E)XK nuclease-like domain-containing protein [Tenggerimyces flavus]MBM7788883.1 hypothetical protein [Tenggerimyces flavus]
MPPRKRKLWLSGFCGLGMPPDSHRRCRGSHGDLTCSCNCHVEPIDGNGRPEAAVEPKDQPSAGMPHGNTAELAARPVTMPAEDYHAHPALSSTGARKLLPPSCPAIFKYEREHPPPPKKEFDFGHAAHTLALGAGPDIVPLPYDNRRTNAYKAAVEEARAAGKVPLLQHEYDTVQEMVWALRTHPDAALLLDPDSGAPEQSLFWTDDETGVACRARLDWLPKPKPSGLVIAWDYKTTQSAAPDKIAKAIDEYGYFQQAPFYLDGMRALDLAGDDAVFLFVFQEREPPYLVTVVQLPLITMEIGAARNRQARELFRRCVETDHWPAYAEEPILVGLPTYSENRYLQELAL